MQEKLEASCGQAYPPMGGAATMKGTVRGSTMCAHSVEGETQRAVTRSKQRLPLGLQSRHTIGIEEGEQESRSPPAILACTSPQR